MTEIKALTAASTSDSYLEVVAVLSVKIPYTFLAAKVVLGLVPVVPVPGHR